MKKNKIKTRVLRWFLILIGVGFTIPALWNLVSNSYQLYRLKKLKQKLEIENIKLREELSKTQTSEYVEKVARIKLGLKKSNEIEYRFVEKR